jgi:hypothetical protein
VKSSFSEGVILSAAKDLLFVHAEDKADLSIARLNKPTTGLPGTPRKIGAIEG